MQFARRSLFVCLALIFVGFNAPRIFGDGGPNPCSGTGSLNGLNCSGNCIEGSQACRKLTTSGPGGGNWKFCGCSPSGWACCHLIWKSGTPAMYSVAGDCISCKLQDTCFLGGAGTLGVPYQAVCGDPGGLG